jgi:hypothetical protein
MKAAALALALAATIACGAPPEPGAPVPTSSANQTGGAATGEVSGSRSANAAQLAARAGEPRTGDPTAAPARAPGDTVSGDPSLEGFGAADPKGAEEKAPPARIGARHVLIQWMGSDRAPTSVVRTRDQALVLAKEVHRRAKAGEDFARLAVEYSDEPGAGGRGGSLGRFGKGQMVPAFEEAAFKLKAGQVSDIVETGFGFHVIQRTD